MSTMLQQCLHAQKIDVVDKIDLFVHCIHDLFTISWDVMRRIVPGIAGEACGLRIAYDDKCCGHSGNDVANGDLCKVLL